MHPQFILRASLLFFALGVVTLAAPSQKIALVRFMQPTIIAGAAVVGPVIFEHDDDKMARGEPCTTVYYVNRDTGLKGKRIVSFMCVPHERPVAAKFAATLSRTSLSGPERLLEYQFAGEREGHGVPISAAHTHEK